MRRYRRNRDIRFDTDYAYEYLDKTHEYLSNGGDLIWKALDQYTRALRLIEMASRDKKIDSEDKTYVQAVYPALKDLDKKIRELVRLHNETQAKVVVAKQKV